MKFYWVLGWYGYYPLGGLDNVIITFDSLDEANDYANSIEGEMDYIEVVDIRDEYL